MILSLELSHSETGIVAQCPWLCDIQTWLSGPPKDSILMQARTEQYPKAKKKTGNPKESQKTDYQQNGKYYSQFAYAAFNQFCPKLKRTIKIKVLAATSQCAALFHHKVLITSSFCFEILEEGRGRMEVPGLNRLLLKSCALPWSKVLSQREKKKSFIFQHSHLQDNLT